ncbi:MAG: serine protease [Pseudolabrys sp.]|nr:serine protease [Pseudolabrys sp.]MDP2295628.1 serine protease [Pseudolabrys sp.]
MRLVPIVTLLALSFGAVSASAQVPGADAAPYPAEAGPADTSAKQEAKQEIKPAAKPAAKPAVAPAVAPAKSAATPIVLPPVRPDAIKAATAQPAAAPVTQPPAAPEHERELGWSVVADPATGVHIGLPTKMVPHARDAARGTRWSSAHGEVQVETFRIVEPGLKLSALFEKEKSDPGTRKVEYSTLRDDSFFVSGLQGLKKFSVRASLRNGEVRGFTMMFDQAMEGIVAPVMVAMASSFAPFPQHSAPFAALARPVEYGNGVIVSAQGHIVTDARLTHGCQVIVAAGLGDADRVAEDSDNGLALLRVYGPRKFTPLAVTHDAAAFKAADVTLAGIPDPKEQTVRGKVTEIKARVTDGNSIELRQPEPLAGFSGAAALDGDGRFVGMAEMRNAVLASAKPAMPPLRLIRAATIRGFLDAHHVPAVTAQSGDTSASVVRIICVRK